MKGRQAGMEMMIKRKRKRKERKGSGPRLGPYGDENHNKKIFSFFFPSFLALHSPAKHSSTCSSSVQGRIHMATEQKLYAPSFLFPACESQSCPSFLVACTQPCFGYSLVY